MNSKLLTVFLIALIPFSLFGAEPSAFGAGNLNSSKPYGLTSNEKVLLQTKKDLHTVVVKSNNQKNEVDSIRERIDGLQGIIESLSRKAHNNKIKLSQLKKENSQTTMQTSEYEKRLSQAIQKNKLDIDAMHNIILELSLVLETLKKDYVTKLEFNTLVESVNNFKDLVAKELKKRKSKPTGDNAQLYKQAKNNYAKRYYSKAITEFETLIKRSYKPAYSHYMIGEMNYKRKNYANAITYFKKSSSLYSKASYMPTLMLHTAISMEKTGDSTHAEAFYNALVVKYPSSKESTVARRNLGL